MGLKEVLSTLKLVDLDSEPVVSAGGLASGPGSAGGSSAGRPGSPAKAATPAAPDLESLLGSLPDPPGAPEIGERALREQRRMAAPVAPGRPAAAAMSGTAAMTGTAAAGKPAPAGSAPRPADGGGTGSAGDAGDVPDFPSIYKAAGISDPPHGYSAFKVLEILSSSDLAGLEPRAKAAALSGFLKMNPGGPVPIADVIQDAVRRDQALDKFEEFLRAKLVARSEQIEKENAALQAEIDALTRRNQEAMETNRGTLSAEQARLARWQVGKRIEERRLFDAVAPFVESNPITTSASAPEAPAKPPSDPRRGNSGG